MIKKIPTKLLMGFKHAKNDSFHINKWLSSLRIHHFTTISQALYELLHFFLDEKTKQKNQGFEEFA
ncbi:hypothetical protein GCM10023331_03190 [Algivirga pacifica]|uniref:Uncharacterized protein n=1 Tax=Algivirga pacifica TaxID=1162670 RepID=A0ABP9D395_9BACT